MRRFTKYPSNYIKASDDWSDDRMRDRGELLYSQYGPDVDVYDMSDYDAECYLLYKRLIGE